MDILGQYNKDRPEVSRTQPQEMAYSPETSKMIQWVMKYSGGLVKTEKQANYILIGFAVVAIMVALVLVFGGGETSPIRPEDFKDQPQFSR